MKLIIIHLTVLFSLATMAQDTSLTKRNLNHIFTKNANGKLFGWKKWNWDDETSESYKETYNSWVTTNDDSTYYKSDTIVLYNYSHPYNKLDAQEFTKWRFKKRNLIGINNFNRNTSGAIYGYTTLRIKNKAKSILIILKDYDERITNFKVIDLRLDKLHSESDRTIYVMTLVRI
jgi:hypothetical protein